MPLTVPAHDPRLTWQGVVSLERTEDWVMPWRIPHQERGLFYPEALQETAAAPAGVRIAFRSDTTAVAGRVEPQKEVGLLDLYCDGKPQGSVPLSGQDSFRFEGLPAGDKLVELWLPQTGRFRLRALELSGGATLSPHQDRRPRWTTYGSSISHCGGAESPSQTWPAIVAREHGLDLTCLGYGGNCHLEPMVARMMRDIPADFLSIKVGINVYGGASLGIRTFRPAVIGFVRTVRDRHPDAPFAVVSPIISPPREDTPNAVGFTLRAMREEVAGAVEALRAHGDANVHYVDGLKVFGAEYAHLLPDHVHPNAEGYKALGRSFLRHVASVLFTPARSRAGKRRSGASARGA